MIRRLYVLVQRELWEHRALYVTPFVISLVVLLGVLVALVVGGARGIGFDNIVKGMQMGGELGSMAGVTALVGAPSTLFVAGLGFLVFFYSIDALYAERKDRSILFWKSLPLTDTEVVVSKVVTAAFVAPLITFGFLVATQLVILAMSGIAVWLGGGSASELVWGPTPVLQIWTLSVYWLLASALWFLPFIAWGLFCSAFAKKNVFLWTVLPFVVVPLLERLVFNSGVFARTVFSGRFGQVPWLATEFGNEGMRSAVEELPGKLGARLDLLSVLDPGGFLTTPGLWGGLVVAAVLIAGAIYFRRYRDETASA